MPEAFPASYKSRVCRVQPPLPRPAPTLKFSSGQVCSSLPQGCSEMYVSYWETGQHFKDVRHHLKNSQKISAESCQTMELYTLIKMDLQCISYISITLLKTKTKNHRTDRSRTHNTQHSILWDKGPETKLRSVSTFKIKQNEWLLVRAAGTKQTSVCRAVAAS